MGFSEGRRASCKFHLNKWKVQKPKHVPLIKGLTCSKLPEKKKKKFYYFQSILFMFLRDEHVSCVPNVLLTKN